MLYTVTSLEAWPNEDGWDINDFFPAGYIDIPEDQTRADFIKSLEGEYLKEGTADFVEIYDFHTESGLFEVRDKHTGQPLYHFEEAII